MGTIRGVGTTRKAAATLTPLQTLVAALGSNYRVYECDPTLAGDVTVVSSAASVIFDQLAHSSENAAKDNVIAAPTVADTINSRPALRWNKAAQMVMNLLNQGWGNARTFAFIFRFATTPSALQEYTFVCLNDGADGDMTRLDVFGAALYNDKIAIRTHATTSGPGAAYNAAFDTNAHLHAWTHTGTNPDTGYALYADDMTTPKTTTPNEAAVGISHVALPSSMIGLNGAGAQSDIIMGCMVLGKAALGSTERAALKAYANAPIVSGGWGMSVV